MFGEGGNIIFGSAEGFDLGRRRVLAEKSKKALFCTICSVQNRSEKPRFSQSRCSKLTGRGGCVLYFQVAVHRGLMSFF